MGNEQFNSFRSRNDLSSRHDYNDFSPSRNAYNRGETPDRSGDTGQENYGIDRSNEFRNSNSREFGRNYQDQSRYGNRNQSSFGNQSAYGSSSYGRNRDHDRDWSDRAGDEVKSWFGDDDAERRRSMDERRNRDNDSWGNNDSWTTSRDRFSSSRDRDQPDTSRTLSSGRYTSDNDRTGYNQGYGNSYGSSAGNDRYGSASDRYGSGDRFGSSDRYSSSDRYKSSRDHDDRGFIDRAGDEVRSWFGDEDAERRRRMDDLREYNDDRDRNRNRDGNRRSSATYTSGPPYSYGSSSRRDYEW